MCSNIEACLDEVIMYKNLFDLRYGLVKQFWYLALCMASNLFTYSVRSRLTFHKPNKNSKCLFVYLSIYKKKPTTPQVLPFCICCNYINFSAKLLSADLSQAQDF